jgi:uncharacterized membrane protein YuzA (DUF378 family)
MKDSATVWIVVGFALVAANLPFLFDDSSVRKAFGPRSFLLLVLPFLGGIFTTLANYSLVRKVFGHRGFLLLMLYFLVGIFAFVLEKERFGSVYPKNWQFYAATFCLFIVFAFPGFIYRHLWRGNRRRTVKAPLGQE